MAKRIAKSAVELASDIGSKALDLHQHGDVAAVLALRYLMGVNPEIFEWFRQQLEKAKQVANPYAQTEALIEQRTIGHGEGQEHATAEWQAALADRDATIARLRAEHDRHVEWTAEESDKDGRDVEIDWLVGTIARLREVMQHAADALESDSTLEQRVAAWDAIAACFEPPLTPAKEAE